jgi:hypothetical protein
LPRHELTEIERALKSTISTAGVNALGVETGQSERLRVVTPHRLFLAVVGALASARVESLADLLREFNHQNGTDTRYKAFYNRLARPSFSEFMRQMLGRLLQGLALKTLQPEEAGLLSQFEDIMIHDGSSFALKSVLRHVFPGRFTTIEPAAVEIHATFSGFADNVMAVTLTADTEAERHFLPDAQELRNKLLLADRGYPAVPYFEALSEHNASFIMRLSRSFDPWVLTAYERKRAHPLKRPVRLSEFLSQHQGYCLDLDVEFERGKPGTVFRLLVLPGKEKAMTRLCTNLARTRFSFEMTAKLYRFRWQVELCFKEWKSYANLHAFDTGNEHIAAGLIWAGICAAVLKRFLAHAAQIVGKGVPVSTRRVAMCARHLLDALVADLLRGGEQLRHILADGIAYLLTNARRANPVRDRATGRLRTGLAVVGSATWARY